MPFNDSDKKLLNKFIKIWEKISNLVGKELDTEPVYGYNDKYINTKIKIHRYKVNTNFKE